MNMASARQKLSRFLALITLASASCSEVDVYIPPELRDDPVDNRVSISGAMCAEKARDLDGFLKIMFVIDRSNSMLVTDPNNRRIDAVREVVTRFVEDPATYRLQPGVQFAVVSFYGDVMVHTRNERGLPGFSSDGQQILTSLVATARTGANTGYDKALAMAFLLLDSDMAKLPDIARARSRYEIVFLSDGMPFPNNCRGEANSPTAAVSATKRIVSLSAMHRVPIVFNAAFASHPGMFTAGNDVDLCEQNEQLSDAFELLFNGSLGEETRGLLMEMANTGGGTFTQFDNGDAISFDGFELSKARRMYALSQFVVANTSAHPALDHVEPDSDSDGLSDLEELLIGTSPTLADTDDDGVSDFIEARFRAGGLDPLDLSDARCTIADSMDTDGDGLRDCEEAMVGTSRLLVDTDGDGLTDDVELRGGGDPRSATPLQDSGLDSDADGGSNLDELRWHTNPVVDDAAFRASLAYNYHQTERPINDGQACYDFAVSNIQLASTRGALESEVVFAPFDRPGWNRIMLYFAQAPYDDPLGDPLFRVACVDARFIAERDLKMPAGGRVDLPLSRPSHSFMPSPVLRPNQARCNAGVNQDCGLDTYWCQVEDSGACNCYRPPRAVGDPDNGTLVGPCPACSDGQDNDGDGKTDFPEDPDCFDTMDDDESPSTACKDGVDNDGDGKIDWPFDPGCESAYDNDESDPATAPQCADGIDNDGNGFADFPEDPGCYAAADAEEDALAASLSYACSDGLDNDGDGLIDLEDPGCYDGFDIDEEGPATCFFCERITDNRPGQCDLASGYCRPRAGLPPSGAACQSRVDCRGAPCVDGRCVPCLTHRNCDSAPGAGDGVCDPKRGWCLAASYTPIACASDAGCEGHGGQCDTTLGYCPVDPYAACRDDGDCRPDELCSKDRGFCLARTFTTRPCDDDDPCEVGRCDEILGWCLPDEESTTCHHDDLCPYGSCLPEGYCEQATFVEPTRFDPSVDCLRAR